MSEKVKDGFVIETEADDGTCTVTLWKAGEALASEIFNLSDIEESPIYPTYLVKTIWPMLGARKSSLSGLEKLQACREEWDMWGAGEFKSERKTGIRTTSPEVEAVARVTGQSIDDARLGWKALSTEHQKALFLKPNFAEALAKVQAMRLESDAPTDLAEYL